MEGKDILKGITLEELLKKAVEAKAEITVTMGPDNTEVRVEPWKPFEYVCPAGQCAPEKTTDRPDPGRETVIDALGLNLWERVFLWAFANKMSFQDAIRGMLKSYLEEEEAPEPLREVVGEDICTQLMSKYNGNVLLANGYVRAIVGDYLTKQNGSQRS